MTQVTLPIRIMQLMGIETLILTNAAGGVGEGLSVGDVMMIRDHINFTGMTGFLAQDSCVTESMGPRFDRSAEYLGQSDAGIVAVRNMLLRAIGEVEKGGEPPHILRDPADNVFTHVDACQVTIPQGADWREVLPHVAGPKGLPGVALPKFHDFEKHLKRET